MLFLWTVGTVSVLFALFFTVLALRPILGSRPRPVPPSGRALRVAGTEPALRPGPRTFRQFHRKMARELRRQRMEGWR